MSARTLTARPGTTNRPVSHEGHDSVDEVDDGSSDLTHGSDVVFCGNPLKALKARKHNVQVWPC